VTVKIISTKDRGVNLLRGLVFGLSGVGKTTSLGTLPEKETLIVSVERGLLPLADKNYTVAQVKTWNDLRELIAILSDNESEISKSKKIIAFDSLSEISEMCKKQIVHNDRKKLITERSGGKRSTPEKVYDDLMVMEDWGLYRARMMAFIGAVVHLPFHVIFTSLETWTEDKKEGGLYRTPNLNGKLALEIPAFFDLVLHMEIEKDGDKSMRIFRTAATSKTVAKDASGKLDEIEVSDWNVIFKKILTKKKGAKNVK